MSFYFPEAKRKREKERCLKRSWHWKSYPPVSVAKGVSIEINPFKHRYFSTQTNLVYLGLVYVTMITGTCRESKEVRGVTGV